MATADDLRNRLLTLVDATTDDLVLDCVDLQFIDSTGVAVLVHAQRLLDTRGRSLRVENLHGMPRRTLQILGLLEALEGSTPAV